MVIINTWYACWNSKTMHWRILDIDYATMWNFPWLISVWWIPDYSVYWQIFCTSPTRLGRTMISIHFFLTPISDLWSKFCCSHDLKRLYLFTAETYSAAKMISTSFKLLVNVQTGLWIFVLSDKDLKLFCIRLSHMHLNKCMNCLILCLPICECLFLCCFLCASSIWSPVADDQNFFLKSSSNGNHDTWIWSTHLPEVYVFGLIT